MNRLILRAINSPLLVVFALVGISIQTSLFAIWPLHYIEPDIVLLLVIWCALKRSFTEGGVITLLIAEMAELHSAAPQGLYLLVYMAIYLLVRLAARIFVIPDLPSIVMVTVIGSVFWKIASMSLVQALGASSRIWSHTLLFLIPGAAIEALFAYWIYQKLDRFDTLTFKNAAGEAALEEDLQIDNIGF